MRNVALGLGIVAGLTFASPATAHPDGAPWGSANPQAKESCASCHFDSDAVYNSNSISVFFSKESGDSIALHVQFFNPHNKKVGFQIMATSGSFASMYEDIEVKGAQARSIMQRDNKSWPQIIGSAIPIDVDVTMWKLQWVPPEKPDGDIDFWIAVNESNDDKSPLGDEVHYKSIKKAMPGSYWLLPPF